MADDKKYFDVSPPPLKQKNHAFLKKDEDVKDSQKQESDDEKQETKEAAAASPDLEQPVSEESKIPKEAIVNHQAPEVKPLIDAISEEPKAKDQDKKSAEPESEEQPVEAEKEAPADKQSEEQQPGEKNENEPQELKNPEEKTEQDEPSKPEENNTPTPPVSSGAIDALPDPGEKATVKAQDNMQEPKIYDTKEYYVPIGKAHHKHGNTKMAFFFGVLLAILVIAAAVYIMFLMGR